MPGRCYHARVSEHPNNPPNSTRLTWANALTALRLLCIAPCAWAIAQGQWGLAALLFVIAVITDLADGPLARRFNQASPFGGLFDHGTDALFCTISLSSLAWIGVINPWLPLLVALAFIQYMFDSRALAGLSLKTSFLGRNNGIAYFVMVGIPVVSQAASLHWPPEQWIAGLAWGLVATTGLSMADRAITLIRARQSDTPAL